MDLLEELKALIHRLEERRLPYALCGGLAMAVYGIPRSTVDIDLLVPVDALESVKALAGELGYTLEARPMSFAEGRIVIHRVSKPQGPELLTVDLLVATPSIEDVWKTRRDVEWEGEDCR